MKKRPLDCFGSWRLSNLLAWPGIAAVLLCGYLWEWSGDRRFIIGIVLGTASLLAGLIVGWFGIVCPRCGAPLYQFPRLPRHIPRCCPRCGEEITKEMDS